jgi:hypothetical protein
MKSRPTMVILVINIIGEPNGCGTSAAIFYFISFLLIVTFIFLNLFIAIILEGFTVSNESENMKVSE